MSTRTCLSLILVGLSFGAVTHSRPAALTDAVLEDKWIAEKEDNICGINDLKKVSNPAKVDYDRLWDATPQIKRMKDENIDPDSAEGKALRNQAKTLITKKSQKVRAAKGHCGVWKAIKNADGREVTDVTSDVLEKLNE